MPVSPPGAPPVPPDVAKYIESIPKDVRANKSVADEILHYEQIAYVRGKAENEFVAAQAAVKAHPDDETAKLHAKAAASHLKVAANDEAAVHKTLQEKVHYVLVSGP